MPKKRTFRIVVHQPVEVVRKSLKSHTRFRITPDTSSILGGGDLGGRVGAHSFVVAQDPRTFVQRLMPTARGELKEAADGSTVVEGVAGMGTFSTTIYRASFVILPLVVAFLAWDTFNTGGSWLLLSGITGLIVFMMGWLSLQVAEADDRIQTLVGVLEGAVGGTTSTPEVDKTAQRSASKRSLES